jgi:hypothetical protein
VLRRLGGAQRSQGDAARGVRMSGVRWDAMRVCVE